MIDAIYNSAKSAAGLSVCIDAALGHLLAAKELIDLNDEVRCSQVPAILHNLKLAFVSVFGKVSEVDAALLYEVTRQAASDACACSQPAPGTCSISVIDLKPVLDAI